MKAKKKPANKTATPRRRTSHPTFKLSGLERMLLVLYHTVPVAVRAEVGQRLFDAWTHPTDETEADINHQRWDVAKVRFKVGVLGIHVLDEVKAGEAINGGVR